MHQVYTMIIKEIKFDKSDQKTHMIFPKINKSKEDVIY